MLDSKLDKRKRHSVKDAWRVLALGTVMFFIGTIRFFIVSFNESEPDLEAKYSTKIKKTMINFYTIDNSIDYCQNVIVII